MQIWNEIQERLSEILSEFESNECNDPFFRGHARSYWLLLPGLARLKLQQNTENRLYGRFTSLGSMALGAELDSWETVFSMQHHGLPTRLLDWSENFATALYFALRDSGNTDAAIWVLDPFRLNADSYGRDFIIDLSTEFPQGYGKYFINKNNELYDTFPADIMAIMPDRSTPRILAQRGAFSIHKNLEEPLEKK